jgi:hypothetical protein
VNECVCVWEWKRTHLLICVYEWERELTSLPSNHTSDNLLANRILDERTDGSMDRWTHTISAETLNPKPGHTQEDTHYTEWYPDIEGYPETHYTEWYPLRTHPRGYPLHWVIPIPWVLRTHPRVYPSHWGTPVSSQTNRPMTPRDTPDTEGYPSPWVSANRIPDGRTDGWKPLSFLANGISDGQMKTQFFYIVRYGVDPWRHGQQDMPFLKKEKEKIFFVSVTWTTPESPTIYS